MPIKIKNQENLKNSPNGQPFPPEHIANNAHSHIVNRYGSDNYPKVLKFFVKLRNVTSLMYFSQEYIAHQTQLSLRTIKRILPLLVEDGFLAMTYRGVKQTCLYTVARDFFNQGHIRAELSRLFPCLSFHSVKLLLSAGGVALNNCFNKVSLLLNYGSAKDTPDLSWVGNEYLDPELHSEESGMTFEEKTRGLAILEEQLSKPLTEPLQVCPVGDVIKSIQSIKGITKKGQLSLTRFADEALIDSDKKLMLYGKKAKDPYVYLCKLAHEWHKANGVPVNNRHAERLMALFKCNPDGPLIDLTWKKEFEINQSINQSPVPAMYKEHVIKDKPPVEPVEYKIARMEEALSKCTDPQVAFFMELALQGFKSQINPSGEADAVQEKTADAIPKRDVTPDMVQRLKDFVLQHA
jgi:hypothetical protein